MVHWRQDFNKSGFKRQFGTIEHDLEKGDLKGAVVDWDEDYAPYKEGPDKKKQKTMRSKSVPSKFPRSAPYRTGTYYRRPYNTRSSYRRYNRSRPSSSSKMTADRVRSIAINSIADVSETKKAFINKSAQTIDNNVQTLDTFAGPIKNINPIAEADYMSTAQGQRIHALGMRLWLDISNTTNLEFYVVFEVIEVWKPATIDKMDIYYDPRDNAPGTIMSLPFVERLTPRIERNQSRKCVYKRVFKISESLGSNSGSQHRAASIWIPINKRLKNEDASWELTHEWRAYAIRADGEENVLANAIQYDFEGLYYFKDY